MSRLTKIDLVGNALSEKTRDTDNWLTVTTQRDGRHKYKYVIKNVVTNNLTSYSFKSLNDIIKFYELEI